MFFIFLSKGVVVGIGSAVALADVSYVGGWSGCRLYWFESHGNRRRSCWLYQPKISILPLAGASKSVQLLILGLYESGKLDALRRFAAVAAIFNVENGLVGVCERLVFGTFLVLVALLVYSKLNEIYDVGYDADGIFEANGEVVTLRFVGQELDVVDVRGFVITKAILAFTLEKKSAVENTL